MRFDYILANPPFNVKKWNGDQLRDDARWKYWVSPLGNANYAWVEHIISKLTPNGKAGFVLANWSLSTSNKNELAIRKAIIEDDKIDAIVAMPEKMFYSTGIPVSLWFIDARNLAKWWIEPIGNFQRKISEKFLTYTMLTVVVTSMNMKILLVFVK